MPDDHPRIKKKKSLLTSVNQKVLENLNSEMVEVEIKRIDEIEIETAQKMFDSEIDESELDEMWSFVGSKKNPLRAMARH
ncbi:hypothetical protein [Aphanothece hegewaldii]|uniref:hypothetical protein n=1 Tax=Aphanothece hegewaldii TaxID=1521625 RepID=UPI001C636FAF